MEELLYRGLFLQKYEPFLGKGLSNVLTAIVFAIMHTQVTYAAEMITFLMIVLVLSLIWGALIQKSDSLWGRCYSMPQATVWSYLEHTQVCRE